MRSLQELGVEATPGVPWSAFEMLRSAPGKRATSAAPIVRTDTGAAEPERQANPSGCFVCHVLLDW